LKYITKNKENEYKNNIFNNCNVGCKPFTFTNENSSLVSAEGKTITVYTAGDSSYRLTQTDKSGFKKLA
jgi:hypothetical protein